MSRGSCSLLLGACAAASVLAACGGGGSGSPAVVTPQARPAAVAKLSATINGTPALGTPGTYTLTFTVQAADGTALTGTYPTPITLSDSDTSGATRLSTTTVPGSGTVVSLIYSGLGGSTLGGFHGATITATSGPASFQVPFLSSGACVTYKAISGYYPCDLQNAYSLPSTSAGFGQTIAIVDAFDDPNAEADMTVYRAQFGLPPCTTANGCFRKVNQSGVQNSPPVVDTIGWSVEASLDLDMASAICPNCHIIFVEANSDSSADLGASVDVAAALGATQISNSYGQPEFPAELAEDVHYNHPSAMVVVSSGDSDYGVQYPSASPYVTAVGGTNLTVASNSRGWNEFVWNNANVQGAGSGCSAYEPKPAWQHDPGCPNRMIADVSAVADPYSAVAIYDTFIVSYQTLGGWQSLGGTSASAPIIAGIYALGGASAATLNYASYLYGHGSGLNDIVNGANGTCPPATLYFCTAAVGYDGPTGVGTPIGAGGFGGPVVTAAQSTKSVGPAGARRHILQAAAGSPTVRVCPNPKPGHFACNAILVPTS